MGKAFRHGQLLSTQRGENAHGDQVMQQNVLTKKVPTSWYQVFCDTAELAKYRFSLTEDTQHSLQCWQHLTKEVAGKQSDNKAQEGRKSSWLQHGRAVPILSLFHWNLSLY